MKQLLYLKDDQLKDLIEKLFIGYRETFSDSKKILNKYKIGLAHQKVIHLLSMYEGITISELLKRLKVTKQSLNRVLKDLIKLDIIIFKKDEQDTRIKHVFLNDKGKKIFNEIFEIQKKRIHSALLNSLCLTSTSLRVDIPTSYLSLASLTDSLLDSISFREEIIFSSFNLRFK